MEIYVPAHAARALEALEAAGWESWVVGGCVRDALLGLSPHDWDLCTAAAPEQVLACFAGKRLLETGRKHGTVTLLTPDGPLEITTFRRDGAYTDRRHPDGVEFVARLEEDLARRDFTVNAMAYHPRRGLRDPSGGGRTWTLGFCAAWGTPPPGSGRTRCGSCAAFVLPPGWGSGWRLPRRRPPPGPGVTGDRVR